MNAGRARGRVFKDARDVVLALRLLVLAGLALLGISDPPAQRVAFWSTVILYGVANVVLLLARPARLRTPGAQFGVFLLDAAVVSALVVLRGSQVPQLLLAYFTLVLTAAVAQGAGNALFSAVLVSVLFAAVTLWGRPAQVLLTFPVLSQFAFFFVTALFMGQVAEAARRQSMERARAQSEATRLEAAVAEKAADLRQSLDELDATRSRLRANDRLATLGMLSAGILHEIRNPLAAMRAAIDEVPSLLDDAEEVGASPEARGEALAMLRSAIEDCGAACTQLTRLASGLTALSCSAPGALRPVAARDALDAAARLLRHRAKGHTALAVRCATERRVQADPGRLQQALLNLAGNGFDAMEGRGGTLTLAAEDAGEEMVRFLVEDTGVGMEPGVKGRVFEAFFTTKGPDKGTGLGLHLVREIVQAHGGSIGFDSTPGEGTRFHLEWPAAHDDVPAGSEDHEREGELDGAGRGRRGDHPSGAREDASAGAV